MSAARPMEPCANAARSISPSRLRIPGLRRAAWSDVPSAARSQSASSEKGSEGTTEDRLVASSTCASSGARSRSASSATRCSGSIHGTSSSGAGVATTTTRSTRSGRRAARARATRPPADQPATPTRSTPRLSSTAAMSSAADATVDQRPVETGSERPYPGRSTESSVVLPAFVCAGSGSKPPAPGAPWHRTTRRSSDAGQSARVLLRCIATRRPDSTTKRMSRPYRPFPPPSVVFIDYARKRARQPPRLVPLAPADARPADGGRPRRAARGLGTDRTARRAGAGGGRCSDRLRARARGWVPARARLPNEADRTRRGRGGSALRRPGRRAGPRPRARGRPSQAARLAPGGAAGASRPRVAALPRRHPRLVPRGGPRPAPAGDRRGAVAGPAAGHALPRGISRRFAPPRPARSRPQGGRLVPAREAARRGARLPGIANRVRARACRGECSRPGVRPRCIVVQPLAGVRAEPRSDRGHRSRPAKRGPLPTWGASGRGRRAADGDRALRLARSRLLRIAFVRAARGGHRSAGAPRADRDRCRGDRRALRVGRALTPVRRWAENGLDVDYRCAVDRLQRPDLQLSGRDLESGDAVQAQRVRPVGRPCREDPGERPARVGSRVHPQHVALRLVKPRDDEELVAYLDPFEGLRDR